MKRKRLIVTTLILLVLFSPILFRKYRVPLVSNGKTVAIATRPLFIPFLGEGQCDVYAGHDKIFSLWEDSFDGPSFIYPFADGKRFLCDYDYDVSILVFVVDFDVLVTNAPNASRWPVDDYVRGSLYEGATNVVIETKAHIRLPSYEEVKEVFDYFSSLTPSQMKIHCLPGADFGLFRIYPSKDILLPDLAADRDSVWPMPK